MIKFLIFLTLNLISFIFPSLIYAQTQKWSTLSLNCTKIQNGITIATLQGFNCIFWNILKIIIPLSGLAAFVILIVGGFQYLTSAGDPKQAQKAQSIITGAIIGIVTIITIWFIFSMLQYITGYNPLQFAVPND